MGDFDGIPDSFWLRDASTYPTYFTSNLLRHLSCQAPKVSLQNTCALASVCLSVHHFQRCSPKTLSQLEHLAAGTRGLQIWCNWILVGLDKLNGKVNLAKYAFWIFSNHISGERLRDHCRFSCCYCLLLSYYCCWLLLLCNYCCVITYGWCSTPIKDLKTTTVFLFR